MAVRTLHVNHQTYSIAYEMLHPEQEKTLLILHGWGANKEIMKKAFGRYFQDFCHVYVDLPGFGASSTPAVALDSHGYVEILKAFLEALHVSPALAMGHSFGGKLALLLNPPALVLLSSAGIVPKKPLGVRLKIALFKCLKPLGFGKWYHLFATKDVQGLPGVMYETLKKVVNEDMREHFRAYEGKAAIFWGEEDKATPLQSGQEIARLVKNSTFDGLKGDHFFFLLHGAHIERATREALC